MSYELDQTILERNSIKDATHVDESTGFKFLMLTHTRHAWLGSSWGISYCDFDNLTPIQKLETKPQTIKVKGFEDLIDGKAALIALANGEDVEAYSETRSSWLDAKFWYVEAFLNKGSDLRFRLKPKTIMLNGIEVPAPFEPKEGDLYWYLSTKRDRKYKGYEWASYCNNENDTIFCTFGAWRTEHEIKQVVKALRKVFEVQS